MPHPVSPDAAPPPRLLVSDHVAGRISLLDLPDGAERAEVNDRHLSEHAGFLASRATWSPAWTSGRASC